MRKALVLGLLTSAALLALTVTKTVTLPGNIVETIIVTVTTTMNTKIITQSIIVGNSTFVRTITVVPMQGMTVSGNLTMHHGPMRHGPMMNVTKGMHKGLMNATKTMNTTCGYCHREEVQARHRFRHMTTMPWWAWPTTTETMWGPGMGMGKGPGMGQGPQPGMGKGMGHGMGHGMGEGMGGMRGRHR